MTTCPKCGTRYGDSQRLCPHDGTVLEPDQPPELKQVGKVLDGKYRLDSYLSRGGMGAVYRATHVMLGRPVAVKLIKADLVTSPDIVRRFQREARAVTHLNHPNIVEVYDLGQTEDGTLYIAMELVSGESLSAIIKAAGPLPPDRIVRILGQVVSALALAHRTNIVHRDLKPHNIMVAQGEDGLDVAKLLDFGIAKTFEIDAGTQLTSTGATLGTPQYMSPEQASGAEVDGRSDLYSLGIILYEMLIGEVPFSDPSTPTVLVKHMTEAPMPPSRRRPDLRVSPALETIALRCLEKDPANRFQTAGELGAELQRAPIEQIEDEGATIPLSRQAPQPGQTSKPTVLDPTVPSAVPPVHVKPPVHAEPPILVAPPPLPPPPLPGTRPTVAAVASSPMAAPPVVPPVPPRSRSMLVPIAALVVLIALLGAGYWAMTRPSESAPGSATSSQAPSATPAMADPVKPEASPPAAAIVTPSAPPSAPPPAPRAAAPSSPTPTRATEGAAGQPAPPAPDANPEARATKRQRLSNALSAAGRFVTRQPKESDAPAPATPSVSFECTGPSEVCGPLRSAIQEAAEREGLPITRRSRDAEILLTAEVSIVDRRQQVQFGTTLVTTTYSMDISGEAPRFDQSIPMPASKTFSADARIGAERYDENARLAAADAIERVRQFWKKRVP
jgi:serine/threonine protein kinase